MTDHHPRVRTYDGQRYTEAGARLYQRRDGSYTNLTVWLSHCPVCDGAFEVLTPALSKKWEPNRRCPQHKRPGVPVRRKAGAA
jgi:hypothetical protein